MFRTLLQDYYRAAAASLEVLEAGGQDAPADTYPNRGSKPGARGREPYRSPGPGLREPSGGADPFFESSVGSHQR